MKKQQKIIELRTAAKLKVAELETKIAFARSEAAGKRARLMRERAAELKGLEVASMERFDVLAKYRAKLAGVNEQLAATVAQLKFEIQQAKSECERQCADAEDDPEPEKEQPQDNDLPTWLDGEQWTAAVVARRILNKLPKLNFTKESIYLELSPSYFGGCGLNLRYINTIGDGVVTSCELLSRDDPEEQAAKVDLWLKDVEVQMAKAKEIMRKEADNE